MTYTPFEFRVFPIFVYYIFLSIFAIFMSIKMYKKWKERKVPPPLYLTIVFIFFSAALTVLGIGLAEAVITEEYREIYRFSLPFAYSMVIFADIFLFRFATHMTNKGRDAFPLVIIIGVILAIVLYLPWNWWGVPAEDYEGMLNIRLYSTSGLVLFSLIIYSYIALICQKTKTKVDDKVTFTGLKLLFYSIICLILLFVMLIGDTLLITLFDHPGYSEFTYIAWIFGSLFIVLSYFSLVMPKWLIKRIEEN